MKPLVIFVHGFRGSAKGTWEDFPKLLGADPRIGDAWDIDDFEYKTGAGFVPTLRQAAAELREALRTKWADRPRIAILAHSQGGLIARRCIADLLEAANSTKTPIPIDRLMTFATPHHGSGWASVTGILGNRQIGDLDPNSPFLWDLGEAWGRVDGDRRVHCRSVIAGLDGVVGQVSARGTWHPDYVVISGRDHRDLVKPRSADDPAVRTAVDFLLEDSWSPSGVQADHHVPVLRFNHVEPSEAARFVYSARVVDFIGREKEIEQLNRFLDAPEQPFRWMVLHGSGGVGKSRLALELCLALREEWHVGFLAQDQRAPDWARWQPMVPTLIVVDYAARDTETVHALVRGLAGRGASDGTARLRAPVRLLMIERTGAGDWLDRIVRTGTDKAIAMAAHAEDDLPLETIDDPWRIIESVLRAAGKPLPDREATLAILKRIDPERRPLFAHFAADALAHDQDIRQFDAARLLEQVIDRAREKFWRGATKKEERLLAVATMANGLPIATIESYDTPLLPAWDVDRHPGIYAAMTGRECRDGVPPLEPDIVGEHFVLATLGGGHLGQEKRRTLCDLAWWSDPLATAQFAMRAHRDVPGHPMLAELRRAPTDTPGADLPIRLWALACVDLMIILPIADPQAARALLDDLRAVAEARGEPAIWELWAKAATNLMVDLRSRNPDAARALLAGLRTIAVTRGEPAIWERWAKAANNLMVELRSRNRQAARDLLDELHTIATERGEPAIWEQWGKSSLAIAFAHPDDPASAVDEALVRIGELPAAALQRLAPLLEQLLLHFEAHRWSDDTGSPDAP